MERSRKAPTRAVNVHELITLHAIGGKKREFQSG